MDDPALLDLAARLALAAADLVLGIRARGFTTSSKPDRSPVTEADHAAEALITAALREATPDIPVVAEEEITAGHVPAESHAYWLVDPLDGTRDFVAGRDGFTVNIGLVRDRLAVLGAVAIPATAELFGGCAALGLAWKQDRGGRRPIRARPPPPEGLHVLSSRHQAADRRLDDFLKARPVATVTPVGSALKFCRLAEGEADLYPRFGRTMEWDTAGPQAILDAAGGHTRLINGGKLRYAKPGWANPPFVCTGAEP